MSTQRIQNGYPEAKPLISVLLPLFNSDKYLSKAIGSILNQTYSNFELLLLDDGSTDKSSEIAQKYADLDSRIKLYRHNNMGLSKTLQKGVKLAGGKYIARMDSDDIAHPCRFELQVEYLERTPTCVALGTAITVIDPDGDVISQPKITQEHDQLVIELLQWKGSRICHPTVMMRADIVEAVGGYTEREPVEDVDLFLKLAKHGQLANLPIRLLRYRWHINSICHTRNQASFHELKQKVILRAIANLNLSPRMEELALNELGLSQQNRNPSKLGSAHDRLNMLYTAHCYWCLTARESGFYRTSLKYLLRTFQSRPFGANTYWVLINFLLGANYGSKLWNVLLTYKKKLSKP